MAKQQYKQDLQKVVGVRLTNREYALLKTYAESKDQKLSEYCRKVLTEQQDPK